MTLAAILLAGVAVASGCGRSAPDPAVAVAARAVTAISRLPQDGITLGATNAPATLTVYTSLDTFNAGFLTHDFGPLVERYVAPGRVRLQLRTLGLTATDAGFDAGGARRAARLAQAAGLQDRLWQFFATQSAFYAGYVDEPELQRALVRVRGLDQAQVKADAGSPRVTKALARGEQSARTLGVSEGPAFSIQLGTAAPRRIADNCDGCLVREVGRALSAAPSLEPVDTHPGPAPTCLHPGKPAPAQPSSAAQSSCAAARKSLGMLKGVPRSGAELGANGAKVVLGVSASPGQLNTAYVEGALRDVIKRFVRPGRLRLRLLPRWGDTDRARRRAGRPGRSGTRPQLGLLLGARRLRRDQGGGVERACARCPARAGRRFGAA